MTRGQGGRGGRGQGGRGRGGRSQGAETTLVISAPRTHKSAALDASEKSPDASTESAGMLPSKGKEKPGAVATPCCPGC
jgi:hypothetical protein